jgi:hypothetical protein
MKEPTIQVKDCSEEAANLIKTPLSVSPKLTFDASRCTSFNDDSSFAVTMQESAVAF